MRLAWLVAIAACMTGLAQAQPSPPPLQDNVHFAHYGTLARNSEILGRVFTPLTMAGIERELARAGKKLSETPFHLAAEKFLVYVPPVKPPEG